MFLTGSIILYILKTFSIVHSVRHVQVDFNNFIDFFCYSIVLENNVYITSVNELYFDPCFGFLNI